MDADTAEKPRADLMRIATRRGLTIAEAVPSGGQGHEEAQVAGTGLLSELDRLFASLSEMPSSFTYNDETLGVFACPRYDQFLEEIEDVAMSPHAAQALAIAQQGGRSDETTALLAKCVASIRAAKDGLQAQMDDDLVFLGMEA